MKLLKEILGTALGLVLIAFGLWLTLLMLGACGWLPWIVTTGVCT